MSGAPPSVPALAARLSRLSTRLSDPAEWGAILSALARANPANDAVVSIPAGSAAAITDLFAALGADDTPLASARLKMIEIEYECRMEELAKKLADSRAEVATLASKNQTLEESAKTMHADLSTAHADLRTAESARAETTKKLSAALMEIDAMTQEKRALLKASGHQDQLDAFQQEEYNKLLANYRDTRMELEQLRNQYGEQSVEQTSLKFAKEKIEQQYAIAKSQLEWTQAEWQRSVDDAAVAAKDKSRQVQQLLGKVDELAHHTAHLEQTVQRLTEQVHDRDTELATTRRRVVELETQLAEQEGQFKHELQMAKHLAQRQTQLAEEARKFAQAVNQDLATAKTAIDQLQTEYAEYRTGQEQTVAELERNLDALRTHCRDLEERIKVVDERNIDMQVIAGQTSTSQPFPASTLVGKALQSGKTYSQLWTDLVKKENEVAFLQSRVVELEEGLHTIMCEMEERAPVYAKLTADNDELRAAQRHLNTQLVQIERQRAGILEQCQQWKQRAVQTEEELDAQKLMTSDLARQLVCLLSGMNADVVVAQLRSLVVDGAELDAAQTAISEHLVDFTSVEALVAKNQQLLAMVRQLTEQHEALSRRVQGDLALQLDRVTKERDELDVQVKALQIQMQKLETECSSDATPGQPAAAVAARSSSPQRRSDRSSEEAQNLKLQTEHLQNVIASLQDKLNQADLRVTEEIMKSARFEAQAKYLDTEKASAEKSLAIVRDQLQHLTVKCTTLSGSLAQWEERYDALAADLRRTQAALEKEKRDHAASDMEREVLARTHAHMQSSLEHVTAEREVTKQLLNSTQAQLERQATDLSTAGAQAQMRIQNLEQQITVLTNKLESAQEEHKRMLATHAKELRDLQQECLDKVLQAETRVTSAAGAAPTPLARSLAPSPTPDQVAAATEQAERLQLKVDQLTADVDFLSGQLRQRDERVQEVLAHAQQVETQLAATQTLLDAAKKEAEILTNAVGEGRGKLAETDVTVARLRAEVTAAREETAAVERDLVVLRETHQAVETHNAQLAGDLEAAEDRYRREIQSHAAALQTLERTKERMVTLQDRVRELEAALDTAETTRVTLIAEADGRARAAAEETKQLQEQLDNLRKQNDLLLAKTPSSDRSATELIDLLRADRNALLAEKETAVLEATRHVHTLERRVETLKLQLEAAQAQSQAPELQALRAKFDDQTHQVALLRESNLTLRRESQHHETLLAQTTSELEAARAEVSRLREQQVELTTNSLSHEAQIARYRTDASEWQKKYSAMLREFERVDPQQHQELIEQRNQLQQQCDELAQKCTTLEATVADTVSQLRQLQAAKKKTVEKANAQIRLVKARADEQQTAFERDRQELGDRLGAVTRQLVPIQEELQQVKANLDAQLTKVAALEADNTSKAAQLKDLKMKLLEARTKQIAPPAPRAKRPHLDGDDSMTKRARTDSPVETTAPLVAPTAPVVPPVTSTPTTVPALALAPIPFSAPPSAQLSTLAPTAVSSSPTLAPTAAAAIPSPVAAPTLAPAPVVPTLTLAPPDVPHRPRVPSRLAHPASPTTAAASPPVTASSPAPEVPVMHAIPPPAAESVVLTTLVTATPVTTGAPATTTIAAEPPVAAPAPVRAASPIAAPAVAALAAFAQPPAATPLAAAPVAPPVPALAAPPVPAPAAPLAPEPAVATSPPAQTNVAPPSPVRAAAPPAPFIPSSSAATLRALLTATMGKPAGGALSVTAPPLVPAPMTTIPATAAAPVSLATAPVVSPISPPVLTQAPEQAQPITDAMDVDVVAGGDDALAPFVESKLAEDATMSEQEHDQEDFIGHDDDEADEEGAIEDGEQFADAVPAPTVVSALQVPQPRARTPSLVRPTSPVVSAARSPATAAVTAPMFPPVSVLAAPVSVAPVPTPAPVAVPAPVVVSPTQSAVPPPAAAPAPSTTVLAPQPVTFGSAPTTPTTTNASNEDKNKPGFQFTPITFAPASAPAAPPAPTVAPPAAPPAAANAMLPLGMRRKGGPGGAAAAAAISAAQAQTAPATAAAAASAPPAPANAAAAATAANGQADHAPTGHQPGSGPRRRRGGAGRGNGLPVVPSRRGRGRGQGGHGGSAPPAS
ncbi:hypothetical protein AMAG_10810 [Allomyces macrogynus ATCC 38327]|uniref:Uncharacterized protein n=1 Tax=Allomyces macrogynus (strain ATCC 38327) TaxID=578462 RepID=A0A0L0SRK5_ALLM3|nr:hypothetical protein AMAG_10810 [Allomyces macrogynus ATCC 38327]|eukprot:KNE65157.1 hypothetical protein AMAG_10810 [Allomyces macrogynus ATCC 38327]